MKLPSLRHLLQEALDTFNRFPFAILSATIATGAMLVTVHHEYGYGSQYQVLYNIGLIAFLGIPLFSAFQLVAEKEHWKFYPVLGGNLAILGMLVVYYFSLPINIFETNSYHLIRYALFSLAAHLLVAAGPFAGRGHIDAFWEYNKILFLRILSAALYTCVLFVGLTIAMAAIEHLFNIAINNKRYLELWWFLSGIFNTWFFLSGVPEKLGSLDAKLQYPKALKIFTQYVMIPLVAVYLIILYVYTGKIIVEWNWPKGWVGYLVLGFSITGIFSLLLIHPIKNKLENTWMAAVWRWFFIVLLPLVVLLLLAIWRRTSEYGITERRYFVIVLGLWLAALSLYFILSRIKSIKVIPTSLFALALAVSFGPWGAFNVSEQNQVKRLEAVLVKDSILVNGKVQKAKKAVSFEDAKRINAIVHYLEEVHGVNSIQPWFEQKLDTVLRSELRGRWFWRQENSKRIVQLLGVPYMSEWETRANIRFGKVYSFQAQATRAMETKPYKHFISNLDVSSTASGKIIAIGKHRWNIALRADSAALMFIPLQSRTPELSLDLHTFASQILKQYGKQEYVENPVPQDSMMLTGASGRVQAMVVFQNISISTDSLGVRPISAIINVLLNIKEK